MSLTQEQIKNLKVGDTVYIVPNKLSNHKSPYESTVEKIAKKYIYLDCGRKVEISTGCLVYLGFGANDSVYISEQVYQQKIAENKTIKEVTELIKKGITYQQALLIKKILKE